MRLEGKRFEYKAKEFRGLLLLFVFLSTEKLLKVPWAKETSSNL